MDLRSMNGTSEALNLERIDAPAPVARRADLSNRRVEPGFADLLKMEPGLAERLGSVDTKSNEPAGLTGMKIQPGAQERFQMKTDSPGSALETAATPEEPSELEEKFTEFVGQTLYGSMLASMRKTLSKPAYMHGGRAEEVFQKQLDQVMVEELTEASADSIASPMFDLFKMQKRS